VGRRIERVFKNVDERMEWLATARCIGEDPDLFFPIGVTEIAVEQTSRAKAICATCPVLEECREWSLATAQDAGVWGGLSEEERREIRRERRRATSGLVAVG
jgi:WhiB family transcriptional regulator, redox-sensing transcriptional regulator